MMGIGEYASVAGEDAIPVDLRAHMWDHYRLARNSYSQLESVIRAHLAIGIVLTGNPVHQAQAEEAKQAVSAAGASENAPLGRKPVA